MNNDRIHFELVSPERKLLDCTVDMVSLPSLEGEISILPKHIPLLTQLKCGIITIYDANQVADKVFINGGFAEVQSDSCVVLANEAFHKSDLDKVSVESEIQLINAALSDSKTEEETACLQQRLIAEQAKLELIETAH